MRGPTDLNHGTYLTSAFPTNSTTAGIMSYLVCAIVLFLLCHLLIGLVAGLGLLLRLGEQLLGVFGEGLVQGGVAHLAFQELLIAHGGRLGVQGEGMVLLGGIETVQGPASTARFISAWTWSIPALMPWLMQGA